MKKITRIEKIWAWMKWLGAILINDFILKFGFAWWIYPLFVYPTRKVIRHFWYNCGKTGRILSFFGFIFLNDPEDNGECDDYGTADYRKSIGFNKPLDKLTWYQKWWISTRWSGWRNNNWNSHRFFCPKHNNHSKYTDLTIIEQYDEQELLGYWHEWKLAFCVLKYKFSDGSYADNFGTVLDYENSILGKNFVYYRVNGVVYFRYSKAWVTSNGYAREIQLGTNGRRFKIRLKIRKL